MSEGLTKDNTTQKSQQKVYLIGFMGAGKTYLGAKLAEHFDIDFIETDEEIVTREERNISDIFEKDGEAYFRLKEKEILKEIVGKSNPALIATGGGMPCFAENLDQMKGSGLVIYLRWPMETLSLRLSETSNRPLINANKDNLNAFVSSKLDERRSCYESAHLVVDEPDFEKLEEIISGRLQFHRP